MDGEIIHYLDGLPVEEPLGWRDFEEELDRDIRERLITVKYASELTFTGGGYAYLESVYAQRGECHIVLYEAKQRCNGTLSTCAKGVIILADAEWNLTKCEVRVPVVDDGIGARIINNRDIPISPTAETSKNGSSITPVPAINLGIHDPQGNGTDLLPDTRRVWDWFDAMTHAVAYVTDGSITLVSSWYSGLSDSERYALTDGFELREHTGASNRVVWTLKQLFEEMAGRYNLWMFADRDANGNPQLRIEPEPYFYGNTGAVTQLDIQDLTRTIDADRLYAKVDVGCDTYIRQFTSTPLALPFVPLRTHGKESYHFAGVCNTAETLELTFDFISDSNAIEDVVLNNNEEFDEDIFLLQYYNGPLTPGPETSRAIFSPDGVINVWPFNPSIMNGAILERYYLSSQVGANYGPQTPFSDVLAAPTATVQLTNLNETSASATLFTDYTATAAEYAYFEASVPWSIVSNTPVAILTEALFLSGRLRVNANRYDAGATLLQTQTFSTSPFQRAVQVYSFDFAFGYSLNPGDYVRLEYEFVTDVNYTPGTGATGSQEITLRIEAGATIEKTYAEGGGFTDGLGQGPVLKYTFERHVSLAEWLSLTGNPSEALTISPSSVPLTAAWVSNARRNAATGAAQWEVIAFKP